MLKFQVFEDGKPARQWPIRNAYLTGPDHSAMRGDIGFDGGMITCSKREMGAASLSLQQFTGECGDLTISTCLLPERTEPYVLSVEQARHRLMLIYNKLEEWGMFDLGEEHSVTRRIERARRLFIEAICQLGDNDAEADRLGRECLNYAIDASEELALAHAELLLNRRKAVGSLPRTPVGCGVALDQSNERIRASLLSNFDFVSLPTAWRVLAPAEGEYRWGIMDSWAEWAARSRMPVVAGPVVSFEPSVLPDWIYIWEHDYDTVRDLVYEHTERVVTRYRNVVGTWNVVSGLHVNGHFPFSFDQIMELTRMCTSLVKKIQPTSRVMVELRQPFGEYYAQNQRSIPPQMYADLLVQGGLNFDVFAVRLQMGQALQGQYTRDLLQVAALLDQLGSYGKPVQLTVAVPSEPVPESMVARPDPSVPLDPNCGYWRKPWSQLVQSKWLEALYYIAMSRPYIESVAWQEMVDHPRAELPMSGLVSEDLQPKASFRRLVLFRRNLFSKQPAPTPSTDPNAAGLGNAAPPGMSGGVSGGVSGGGGGSPIN